MLATELEMPWEVVTGPAQEPITLADAKDQARISDVNSDSLINSYIKVARETGEHYMGRGFFTQTVKATLKQWANVIPLPMAAPLQSITSVKYYDAGGTLLTLATSVYDTDLVARPGQIVLKPNQAWPTLHEERLSWRIEIIYVVGWNDVAKIPESIKQGIRMYVTYLDLDRDGMDDRALAAKDAAERCWADRIYWTPPLC